MGRKIHIGFALRAFGLLFVLCLPLTAPAAKTANRVLNQKFLTAVWQDETARAKQLLAQGADVNARDDEGETALMSVCKPPYVGGGDLAMAKLLLAHGAEVNARGPGGVTPLMLAASSGWSEIASALLRQGARVDLAEEGGGTALMSAANGVKTEAGTDLTSPDVARRLLRHGAKVNAADRYGQTALIWAAKCDTLPEDEPAVTETVHALLAAGATAGNRTRSGYTALKWARIRRHRAAARLILSRLRKQNQQRLYKKSGGRGPAPPGHPARPRTHTER
jgi:ankyrin repeat protein